MDNIDINVKPPQKIDSSHPLARYVRVLKDGVYETDILYLSVDAEAGTAVRYKRDANGTLMKNEEETDFLTEEVTGNFEVAWGIGIY